MSSNPDLNNMPDGFLEQLPRMTEDVSERHRHADCEYRTLTNWRITSTGKPIIVLIRVCKCGAENDRSRMLKRSEIVLDEYIDGVEFHLSSECEIAKHPGMDTLIKDCYCPREDPDALR